MSGARLECWQRRGAFTLLWRGREKIMWVRSGTKWFGKFVNEKNKIRKKIILTKIHTWADRSGSRWPVASKESTSVSRDEVVEKRSYKQTFQPIHSPCHHRRDTVRRGPPSCPADHCCRALDYYCSNGDESSNDDDERDCSRRCYCLNDDARCVSTYVQQYLGWCFVSVVIGLSLADVRADQQHGSLGRRSRSSCLSSPLSRRSWTRGCTRAAAAGCCCFAPTIRSPDWWRSAVSSGAPANYCSTTTSSRRWPTRPTGGRAAMIRLVC